ncbi:MAG: GAF domain-containing protein, partial [Actinobacteria bacterium]|nr:GAF domain-containing protein [Actinomycetota bacterium]
MELAGTFAELARALLAEPTLDATLQKIVSRAVGTINGCESAGISLIEKRKITTAASSNDTPEQVDAIQYETDQGPCLEAIRDHEVLCTDDLAGDERWPDFASRAANETGVRSMLSFRLFAESDTMGALNLYSKVPGAFDHDAEV